MSADAVGCLMKGRRKLVEVGNIFKQEIGRWFATALAPQHLQDNKSVHNYAARSFANSHDD